MQSQSVRGLLKCLLLSGLMLGGLARCEPSTSPSRIAPTTTTVPQATAAKSVALPATSQSAQPLASASASAEAPPKEVRLIVHIVPIGGVSQDMIEETVKGLREHAPVDPVVEQAQDFPASSRTAEKNRYRAEVLLDWLGGLPIAKTGKILGVAEQDIVARKGNIPNWGILGLGSLDGRCCVLSTWRMKRKWENGGAPDSLVRARLWKTAVHELGHTLGLEHCPNVGCLLEDGKGTVKTTDRETALCPSCAIKFAEALKRAAQ